MTWTQWATVTKRNGETFRYIVRTWTDYEEGKTETSFDNAYHGRDNFDGQPAIIRYTLEGGDK